MHAAGEKGKRLDQPLDVRVFALVGLDHEAGGYFRVLLRKIRAHLAQEGQLPLVVSQQVVAHQSSRTEYWPLSSCIMVSNVIGSGAGSTFKRASMRKRIKRSLSRRGSSVTVTSSNRGSKRRMAASTARRIRFWST